MDLTDSIVYKMKSIRIDRLIRMISIELTRRLIIEIEEIHRTMILSC